MLEFLIGSPGQNTLEELISLSVDTQIPDWCGFIKKAVTVGKCQSGDLTKTVMESNAC